MEYAQKDVHGLLGQRAISAQKSQQAYQARVHATGRLPKTTRVEVSHQGEGSIIGHYSEYMVASLAEHVGFRFSQFACAAERHDYGQRPDGNERIVELGAARSAHTAPGTDMDAPASATHRHMAAPLELLSSMQ